MYVYTYVYDDSARNLAPLCFTEKLQTTTRPQPAFDQGTVAKHDRYLEINSK